ncbi:hypothetical protein D9757_009070 [Collybiopsis confluens]|uniref:Uncharacterized protein n=1 Tax=Collybiopsis confluens TaxID=2823264 RepID=A0A8H5M5A4_9AGAR|nr:hypothetical protein D9757_009070 [Collybiopsis confluens]
MATSSPSRSNSGLPTSKTDRTESVDLERNTRQGTTETYQSSAAAGSSVSLQRVWKEVLDALNLPEEAKLDWMESPTSDHGDHKGSNSPLKKRRTEEQSIQAIPNPHQEAKLDWIESPTSDHGDNKGVDSSLQKKQIEEQGVQAIPNPHLLNTSEDDRIPEPPSSDSCFELLEDIPEGFPALNFRPFPIRTWFLAVICVLCLMVVAGIIAVDRKAESVSRTFCTADRGQRLAWEYGPMIIAVITKLIWRSVFGALSRMIPFFSLARATGTSEKKSLRTTYAFVGNSSRGALSNHHYLFGVFGWTRRVILLALAPLKSAFVLATPYNPETDRCQEFHVSHAIAMILATVYCVLAILGALVLVRLYGRSTGLKWDPVSIADKMALFHGSNALQDIIYVDKDSELSRCHYRIGYWHVTESVPNLAPSCHGKENPFVWYGIARMKASSDVGHRFLYHDCPQNFSLPISLGIHHSKSSSGSVPHQGSIFTFFRIFLWFSTTITSIVLLSKLSVSGKPVTLSLTSTSSTFFFRAFITFVIASLSLVWINVDLSRRAAQPFLGMYDFARPASENILLHYSSDLPGIVTWNALVNRHYKVAYLSILSLFVRTIVPILFGTLFTITPIDENTSVVAISSQWKAAVSIAILLVYLFSIPIGWPLPLQPLVYSVQSISDLLKYCYASDLLRDSVLCMQGSTTTRKHLLCKLFLAEHRYRYGEYIGTDGKEHLGFDISGRMDRPDLSHVFPMWVEPPKWFLAQEGIEMV